MKIANCDSLKKLSFLTEFDFYFYKFYLSKTYLYVKFKLLYQNPIAY